MIEETLTGDTHETLTLDLPTPFKVGRDTGGADLLEQQTEKRIYFAAAIFHLIEASCERFESVSMGSIDPAEAHKVLLSIREAAQLGRGLAVV